jgi:hypothetical protein
MPGLMVMVEPFGSHEVTPQAGNKKAYRHCCVQAIDCEAIEETRGARRYRYWNESDKGVR